MRYSFAPFLAFAIAFIAIGVTGQRTFIYIGISLSHPGAGNVAQAT